MLLVCSAWEEEIKAIKASNVAEVSIKTLGIGYLEAALQLNKILQAKHYSRIMFLGTAGAYSQELAISEIVNVSSVALLKSLTIQEQAYIPQEYDLYESARVVGEGLIKNADCLSSLEITKSSGLSKKIIEHYKPKIPLVENMELYGVAKVASEHGIPWSAFLGITNYTNANAHEEWKTNHEDVSEKLGKTLLKNLTNINL